jgi:hypothetical protein
MAWQGFCVNYGHQSPNNPYDWSQVDNDFLLLKAIGCTWISIAMPPYGDAIPGGNHSSQLLAIRAKQAGFKVAWGTVARNSDTYNNAAFASYLNEIGNAAAWAHANGIDEWHMGNEHENRGCFISSIAHNNGTATVTTQVAHGFATGDTVSMIWVQPDGFQGDFTITVTGPTTFTFACDPGLPATGSSDPGVTGRCRNYTAATIFDAFCTKAASLKTTYPSLKMVYRSSGSKVSIWDARANLGGLDYVGFNVYGYAHTIQPQLTSIFSKWGTQAILTEWSTDGGFQSREANTEDRNEHDVRLLLQRIKATGFERAFYFCWRDGGFGVTANTYRLISNTNNVRLAAQPLIGGRRFLV